MTECKRLSDIICWFCDRDSVGAQQQPQLLVQFDLTDRMVPLHSYRGSWLGVAGSAAVLVLIAKFAMSVWVRTEEIIISDLNSIPSD